MGVFARKPAPIQVAYLASYSTTGVEAIDYRLSDPYIDTVGSDLSCYSEKTILLPRCTWCYEPSGPTPEIAPLPALSSGRITFGSRNSPLKVSTAVLELWAQIVLAVPGSRLLLTAPAGSARTAIQDVVDRAGLPNERVEFLYQEPWNEFIRSYNSIDIALDPFPYNGWITTCDALWMGVPVVTLAGATAPGRGGRSILMNIGLSELIAETREQYLEIAVRLANDLPRLSEMRAGLRERMQRSPMGDAKGVARELEAAYRQMWLEWIQSRKAP
jgi:predicted O-linked N-acetylglucosamine transferase (SPINDLY family)